MWNSLILNHLSSAATRSFHWRATAVRPELRETLFGDAKILLTGAKELHEPFHSELDAVGAVQGTEAITMHRAGLEPATQ